MSKRKPTIGWNNCVIFCAKIYVVNVNAHDYVDHMCIHVDVQLDKYIGKA